MNWLRNLLSGRRGPKPARPRTPPAALSRRPSLEALEDRLQPSATSIITSNFNGTKIPAGDAVWFNSVLKASGLGSQPVTLTITNGEIDFTANGTPYQVSVPDA